MKQVLLLALVLGFTGCAMVGPDERGISVSMGHASKEVLEPGPYFWFPIIRSVKSMSILVQKTEMDSKAGTRDLQDVQTHAAINWHINPENVVTIYTSVGTESDMEANIITPAFNEVTKSATAKKTAEEVLGKRAELKEEIDKELRVHLAKYGVIVDDVNIINLTFSHDFAAAVEAKQVAEQRAKQAEYEVLQAKNEAQAAIAKARGDSEAQQLLRQTVDAKVLKLRAIEKWDGHFPQVMGSGTLPMLNLKDLTSSESAKEDK